MLSDKEKSWQERAERVVNLVNKAFPEPEFENWGLCEELILDATVAYEKIIEFKIETEVSAFLLNKTALYLDDTGK